MVWCGVVQGDAGRVSWELVVTADFLPTIMDALNVSRPAHQVPLVTVPLVPMPVVTLPLVAAPLVTMPLVAMPRSYLPHPPPCNFHARFERAAFTVPKSPLPVEINDASGN